jgi:tetratricopeptide (TPR) repeat protein
LDEAREVLNGVLTREPKNWSALVGLALLARQRSDHVTSVALFRQAAQHHPNHLGLQLELALSLRHAGLKDAAASGYRSILERDSTNVAAAAGLAVILRESGDPTAALSLLRTGVGQRPKDSTLRLELAAALRESWHLDEAEGEYKAVHRVDARNWTALTGLALLARQRGDHAAALTYLERALALQPGHPGLQSELALTLRHLERLDEAEQVYQRAVRADPRAAAPVQGLSLIALARGQFGAAISLAQAACNLEPGNVDHMLHLAAVYRETGRARAAAALVEDSVIAFPNHAGAWLEKGILLRIQNERASALAAFERASVLDAQRGLIEAAAEHLALGNPAQARAAYERVLASAPMNFAALLGMAALEMLAANYDGCVEICDSLIAAYPKRIFPYRQKCRALIQLDRADEACRIVNELETTASEADAARLEILRTCGRRHEAETLLSLPRVAMTRTFELWLESVLARLAFYDVAGAETALNDPPALRPYERSRLFYAQGILADLQWRVVDAIGAFEQALEMHAADPGAHDYLARLHFLRAEADSSQRHLQAMMHQSSSTLSLRGESHNVSQSLIGQLVNELRLDGELLARLFTVRDESPQRRIELLFEIVKSAPHFTPPAICLMLALRQSGIFKIAPGASMTQTLSVPTIPQKIMQYWDQKSPPEDIAKLLSTWVGVHPGYQYCRFDDAAARGYLATHHPQAVLNAYRRATHPAQASDLFRLAYLFREGGFYIDADDRCVGHLSAITAPEVVLVTYQEQYATLAACRIDVLIERKNG